MTPLARRRFAAAVAALALATTAAAQTPRSFAVVSEFARNLNVVMFQESTGSRLNNNLRSSVPMADGALDKIALLAAREAIQKAEPGAGLWLVAPMESDLFGVLQSFSVGDSVKLPDDVAAEMKKRGNTHLMLLTRYRTEAALQAQYSKEGTGMLEGVGFYVDRNTPTRDAVTKEETTGYLAPYVHARVVLIDAATSRVTAVENIRHAFIYVNTRTDVKAAGPWEAIKNEEKGPYIAKLIQEQVRTAVPLALSRR